MTIDDVARDEHEAWVRTMCPHDLGDSDHRWGWWPWTTEGAEGQSTDDIAWSHRCTNHGGTTALVIARIDIHSGQRHRLVNRNPLHVEASILCPACGDHGFIRDGRWQPA